MHSLLTFFGRLVVGRGTQLTMVQPVEGMEEIANPFLEDDEEEIEVEG